ncbi:hypothetical protein ACQU0X_26885 [Pseudovibrio ascidiaceicola]|uniref:hypothetical protein n=1 Tax=Pseudovibrio ascidiaceicola TaxID=285279 RepID=UPI003D35C7DC
MRHINKTLGSAVLALSYLCCSQLAIAQQAADDCDPAVQEMLDKQQQSYIEASGQLASQNFSRRSGTFSSTTCLDKLFLEGGVDILFKPPNIDDLLNSVMNMACDAANNLIDEAISGSGIGQTLSLKPGELIPGVNLGGSLGEVGISFGTGVGSGGQGSGPFTSGVGGSGGSTTISASVDFGKLFE